MSLFKKPKPEPQKPAPQPANPAGAELPVLCIDFSKRYDVYCHFLAEERLYENMLIVAIRTYEQPSYKGGATLGGFIEMESPSRKRIMIPTMHIRNLCEHGVHVDYKIILTGTNPGTEPG